VAITGLGAVSAVGSGIDALWRALREGIDGIRPITRFSTEGFAVHTAGMVALDTLEPDKKTADHALDFALTAAREAVLSARLEAATVAPTRIAIVFGTSLATHPEGIHRLAEIVGDQLGAHGPRVTVSTACSSSANAIGFGRDLLLDGVADVVIAGGSDALTEEIFAGFHNLGLLTPAKCAPFSDPPGTTLGEGAGFLVLERGDDAARRGAAPVAWVSGYGLSCDAYHATSPDPTGSGMGRAARGALADAGLDAADIDYVNAHGTGTEANDPAEWRGILLALGERASTLPVSSTKSLLGHGQGAAGVLELIATLLAMQHGAIPQTLNFTRPRPRCPEDPVAQRTPRPHAVAHALCNSSAFGGANAIVTIDAPDRPAPSRTVQRRAVWLLGAGLVLPGIDTVAGLALCGAPERLAGRLPAGPVPRSLAGVDLRGFDPLSRLLTFATAEALRDAGLSLRGPLRDRAGLFAALSRISPTSAHELDSSVKERGLLRLSAPAFTRVVLNASTGACARAVQLRGPTTTLTTGNGGGLVALVLAANALAFRGDADVMCVASADEIDRDEPADRLCEAGACVVLGADGAEPHVRFARAAGTARQGDAGGAAGEARAANAGGAFVRVAGWGLAGPGQAPEAMARALAMAGNVGERPPLDDGGASGVEHGGAGLVDEGGAVRAPAAHPLLRTAVALHRLRAGERTSVLLAHDSGSCAAAVILECEPRETR